MEEQVKYIGDKIKTKEATISGEFKTFMEWVDDIRRLKVRTNADTPKDCNSSKKIWSRRYRPMSVQNICFLIKKGYLILEK